MLSKAIGVGQKIREYKNKIIYKLSSIIETDEIKVEKCNKILGKTILKLPRYIVDYLRDGWKIKVVPEIHKQHFLKSDEIATNHTDYGEIYGVVIFRDKRIVLKAKEDDIDETFLHEVGHIVDDMYNEISQSTEFLNIFNNRNRDTCGMYWQCNISPSEYFSEIFVAVIKDKELIKNKHTDAFEFISKLVKM